MTKEQFDLLLQLAHLDVDDADREALMEDIEQVLQYVNKLQDLELTQDAAHQTVGRDVSSLRADTINMDAEEGKAVREAFPVTDSSGLLEAHAVIDRDL